MELWSCASCGSKNAGEACWKCGAASPTTQPAAPSAPAVPPSVPSAPAPAAGSWDPGAAVPHKPAAPSWSDPIAPGAAAPPPAPAPPPAAAAPSAPAPASTGWSTPAAAPAPAAPAAASWSSPAPAAPAAPSPSAPPPSPAAAAVPPLPVARIAVIAVVLLVVLVVVLIVALSHRGTSLTTPSSVEGLPQIHGANVDALAQQARRNAGADGDGMLVGVYGNSEIPSFIFVVVKSRGDSLSSFEQGFMRGASQVGFSPSDLQKRSRGGVNYDCGTVQVTVGVPLSFCFFDDGSATGAGLVPREPGIDRALQLTSSGRGAAESG
ncbi:MAG TPA: hypothetical protein VH134_10250 [Candidatus Dormibacteraeota bacterium]|nr:hypothetical protein [Candidatus Dormibacteraeota bacterium]